MTNTAFSSRAASFTARTSRLREELDRQGWAGILVTDLTDVRYLTGLDSSNAALVVTPSQCIVVTDFRYAEAAGGVPGTEVRQVTQSLFTQLGGVLKDVVGSGTVAYSPSSLTHRSFMQLTESQPDGLLLRAADGVVSRLRMLKDANELVAIRRAASLLEGAYELVANCGLEGRSESEVAWLVERHLREAGASALSFDSIVAGGANGALPHHHPSPDPIPANTLVTVDLGCVADGYCSDCTRTFAVGTPSDELLEIYRITAEAQLAGLDAVRSGASGRSVDAAARAIIDQAGHADHFGHGLGHGVGLQVHEGPRLARPSEDVLEAGMVVTVEPGIYLPGVGGVRIEDLVVVTDDGCEILTGFTKELTYA
jgi:Xaa-Pro aminopeptidase